MGASFSHLRAAAGTLKTRRTVRCILLRLSGALEEAAEFVGLVQLGNSDAKCAGLGAFLLLKTLRLIGQAKFIGNVRTSRSDGKPRVPMTLMLPLPALLLSALAPPSLRRVVASNMG